MVAEHTAAIDMESLSATQVHNPHQVTLHGAFPFNEGADCDRIRVQTESGSHHITIGATIPIGPVGAFQTNDRWRATGHGSGSVVGDIANGPNNAGIETARIVIGSGASRLVKPPISHGCRPIAHDRSRIASGRKNGENSRRTRRCSVRIRDGHRIAARIP